MFCAIACLVSPNKEYDVFIQASPSKGSTFEELSAILINVGEHTLVPESITINGIHGHHVKYTAGNERYYELRFRNPFNHQEYAQLTILISCPETCSDFPTKETHAIDSLIAGIRIDPITKRSTQWCSSLHVQKKTSVSTLQSRESPLLFRERGTAPRKPYCPEKGIRSRESFWKRKKPPGNQPSAHHILLSLGKRRPFYPFLRSKTRKYIKKERALYQNARSKIALASHFDTTKSF